MRDYSAMWIASFHQRAKAHKQPVGMALRGGARRIVASAQRHFPRRHVVMSYSQDGEDLVLSRFLSSENKGFYVDVGAHHPTRFSNTYFFYKKGWRGINIDAMPGSMIAFDKMRPRDTNVEAAISDNDSEIT